MRLVFKVGVGEEFAGPYDELLPLDDADIVEFDVNIPDKYGRILVEGSKLFSVVKGGIDKIVKELKDAGD